jgi:hypothetical protein
MEPVCGTCLIPAQAGIRRFAPPSKAVHGLVYALATMGAAVINFVRTRR